MAVIGNSIIGLGLAVMLCGIAGLLRFRSFYRRLLVSSLIDTIGLLLVLLGLALRQAQTAFSLKIVLLMVVVVLTAPLVTHKIGRSAYLSGHQEGDEQDG